MKALHDHFETLIDGKVVHVGGDYLNIHDAPLPSLHLDEAALCYRPQTLLPFAAATGFHLIVVNHIGLNCRRYV